MNTRALLILCLVVVAADSSLAQRWNISPFAAYRFGGTLQNAATGNDVIINDAPSYGIELDVDPMGSGLKFALLYSHQDTEAEFRNVSSPNRIDLDVDEILVGVIQELYDEKFRPFVGAYVGASYLRPSGFDDEMRLGFGATLGMNYYITKHFGLRMDLRGFGTLVDDGSGFLCGNGACVARWSSDVMWQGEVAGGVFLSF